MPSVHISDNSGLLTKGGWMRPSQATGPTEILGADRHGKMSALEVHVRATPKRSGPVFVGFPAACGIFAPETGVLLYDGRTVRAGDIASGADTQSNSVDVLHGSTDITPDGNSVPHLWAEFSCAACFRNPDRLALRCSSPVKVPPPALLRKHKSASIVTSHEQQFLILDRKGLQSAVAEDWVQAVKQVGELWLYNADKKCVAVPREFSVFGLWYVEALISLGEGFVITYDSAQHTLFSYIQLAGSRPRTVASCRCSCISAQASGIVEIHWKGTGWNPVVSGCVVAPL